MTTRTTRFGGSMVALATPFKDLKKQIQDAMRDGFKMNGYADQAKIDQFLAAFTADEMIGAGHFDVPTVAGWFGGRKTMKRRVYLLCKLSEVGQNK